MVKVNEQLPLFEAQDISGVKITLKDLEGFTTLLVFFPENPGKSWEEIQQLLKDSVPFFNDLDVRIIGVLPLPLAKAVQYDQKNQVPFSLLADPGCVLQKKFGLLEEQGKQTPSALLLDADSTVRRVEKPLMDKGQLDALYATLQQF